jgi:effector-binding domain-containing protein
LAQVFAEVGEHLTRTGTSFAGPAFARFTFLGDRVAVEAGFPVLGEIAGEGRVQPSRLPDGPAAVTVHRGRYEDLEQAYVAINEWLSARGGVPRGPHWEYYYTDPRVEPDPARWRTEVVVPYE